MRSRVVRLGILLLLLAVAAAAVTVVWTNVQTLVTLDSAARETNSTFDRIVSSVSRLSSAQGGYVAPGQPDALWLDEGTAAIDRLAIDVAVAQSPVHSAGGINRLDEISEYSQRLIEADRLAREHLRFGDDLNAAAAVFGDGHTAAIGIVAATQALRESEASAVAAARAAQERRIWSVLVGAGAVWLLGLLLMVRIPRPSEQPATSTLTTLAQDAEPLAPAPDRAAEDRSIERFEAAAELCTALSRVSTTAALTDLLAEAARILDASGLIVWMGAGDDLIAVAAHGYDARLLARLGSITRASGNATAAAWRTGEMRTVAGESTSPGAIVAPMFAPSGCVGVLAAEVRHGREADAAACAVTQLIAAQLATVVAAWPASSSEAAPDTAPPQSDRVAAL